MSDVIYPYDPTGTNPACRITDEQHAVTAVNFKDFHFIIPKAAPFFEDSVVMTAKNPDGSVATLVEGIHYYYSHPFIGASRATAKPVWGSITFLFNEFAGVVKLSYQTVGGSWTLDDQAIAEILANSLVNPRTTAWEEVTGYPTIFPVVDHPWNLVDLVGMSTVVESLEGIRDALMEDGSGGLAVHMADKNNPHETTKVQVGLGNVENLPVSSQAQAEGGTNSSTYMTPQRVAQAIAVLAPSLITPHTSNQSNPHNTTKAQVGLALVDNYATASDAQAITGIATNLFVTPAGLKAAITNSIGGLSAHVNSTANPHNTTAAQVGLGNVQNYGVATLAEAQSGSATDKYMTPQRVAQAIAQLSTVAITNHINDKANPHETNKSQVGLALVDNYPTASSTQAKDNFNNVTFMTPLRTYESIMQFVGNDFVTHLNAVNPHNTTKTTVGLGNVQNYAVATDTEAQAATLPTVYMTAYTVGLAVQALVGNSLAAHLANGSNPHNTSKAQVGLGNVNNYLTAADSDGIAGTAANLYMTPTATRAAVNSLLGAHTSNTGNPHNTTAAQVGLGNVNNWSAVVDSVGISNGSTTQYATAASVKAYVDNITAGGATAHANRTDNPHSTTAAQIGLGNVSNFAVATQADAIAGLSANTYMTPQRVAQYVTPQITTAISNYAARTDNPNQVTAAQVGAPTTGAMNFALTGKLDVNAQAADSQKLGGFTYAQVVAAASGGGGGTADPTLRQEFEDYKVFMAQQLQNLADQIAAP